MNQSNSLQLIPANNFGQAFTGQNNNGINGFLQKASCMANLMRK